ncbi:hypothetical protein BD309DRAFT_960949 [Dichomitus squalens]|uniref:Uncharacterized protein n=1 Tax=Dichomitus squalens TaxID=114155 RepID=A0A4Q9PG00_9APHY|nr:hypothetical protein BD309DRAFT_960949 [Dichomitus squalens]TBU53185.1 hypothetical protein BD310DRAFT_170919 [Dichomitus squalens]
MLARRFYCSQKSGGILERLPRIHSNRPRLYLCQMSPRLLHGDVSFRLPRHPEHRTSYQRMQSIRRAKTHMMLRSRLQFLHFSDIYPQLASVYRAGHSDSTPIV